MSASPTTGVSSARPTIAAPSRPAAAPPGGSAGSSFAFALARAGSSGDLETEAGREALEAGRRFVAQTLVLPILASARETSSDDALFGGGAHERQFASLMDEKLSEEIVRSAGFALPERVARELLGKAAAERSGLDPGVGPRRGTPRVGGTP